MDQSMHRVNALGTCSAGALTLNPTPEVSTAQPAHVMPFRTMPVNDTSTRSTAIGRSDDSAVHVIGKRISGPSLLSETLRRWSIRCQVTHSGRPHSGDSFNVATEISRPATRNRISSSFVPSRRL